MKRLFVLALAVLLCGAISLEASKPRVGVLRFTNQTSAGWWSGSVGTELQDMLASELVSSGAFSILERGEINAVLSEQDLSSSGRISQETKLKLKQIKGARYLIAGTVSAFEGGVSKTRGGLRIGKIGLGGSKGKAYIAVDVKVIDTQTGEIVDARTIEAKAGSSSLGGRFDSGKFGVGLGKEKKTPTGKAIRACIIYITDYLTCSLAKVDYPDCMDQWKQMDNKRKAKTRRSIKLD